MFVVWFQGVVYMFILHLTPWNGARSLHGLWLIYVDLSSQAVAVKTWIFSMKSWILLQSVPKTWETLDVPSGKLENHNFQWENSV